MKDKIRNRKRHTVGFKVNTKWSGKRATCQVIVHTIHYLKIPSSTNLAHRESGSLMSKYVAFE